ncbi:MAG: YceI family protein [Bacteroidetes bacterium]|nr:YceI family protein [Bacteroidota bacterium]
MKQFLSFLLILAFFMNANAQKMYATKSGQIKFNASSPLETIKAVNNQADSRWLESNGQIVFSVLIKGFKFENQLMEDHFNENYMESGKFPKAEFKGFINDIQHIDLVNPGGNEITADGTLTIHGIAQKVVVTGSLTVLSSGKIMLKSDIKIKLKDYNISGNLIGSKIAPDATISVYCIYE